MSLNFFFEPPRRQERQGKAWNYAARFSCLPWKIASACCDLGWVYLAALASWRLKAVFYE